MPDEINTPQQQQTPQATVVIEQGSNGISTIVAALIIAGAAV